MRKLKFLKIFSVILALMLMINTQFAWALTPQSSTSNSEKSVSSGSGDLQPLSLMTSGSSMGKFYSSYSSSNIYNCTNYSNELSSGNSLMFRSNCYGYAFRFFYALDDVNLFSVYFQQPGEFANKHYSLNIEYETDSFYYVSNYADLDNLYSNLFKSPNITNSQRIWILDQLIKLDAATLGYTVTEYTGETIPDAQTYNNKRLIAMVADTYTNENDEFDADFHFYMQHSDNTWSHKRGTTETSNTCIDHNLTLTNETIRNHACEEDYDNGYIKFYYITKDAISDYRHLDGTSETSKYTPINNYDLAGDYLCAAKDIETLPEDYFNGNIDYIGDIDYYVFEAEATGNRNIYVQSPSDLPSIYAKIYNQNGILLASTSTVNGTATMSVNLTASQKYYISFSCPNQTDYVYNRLVYTFY